MQSLICQSCGHNFTPDFSGTMRDHSLNEDYCFNCFKNGEFTRPALTLHELEVELLEKAELHEEISLEEARQVIKRLPDHKRWRLANI
ncbi:zinc ribbon domain-containing protein [Salegentibacter sp. HM20]